ncbi:hypothetical protein H4Q26_018075 [Puccinia striiformis f. sp. tritici PST-130]|nr:hypothetical protein H4Q26_018075 [Puccinia striiformis f. sp. tritici PST-130]
MSPRSGTASIPASAARNRRSVDRAGDRLRSVGRLNDQLLPEDDHRRGRPTGGRATDAPSRRTAPERRASVSGAPDASNSTGGRAVHASVSLGVLSNRQDEPPRQRAVLTDRSVVTALPSTTPRPVLKSSADDSETPHPGPRDRARRFRPVVDPKVRALTPSRRVRVSSAVRTIVSRDGPESPPGCFSRVDTALEAFRRNPTDGSLAPTPARASAEPNVRTCRSSYWQDYYRNDCRRKALTFPKRVNNPTLGEFCFAMIEEPTSKDQKATGREDREADAFAVPTRTERPGSSQHLPFCSTRVKLPTWRCPRNTDRTRARPAETPRTRTRRLLTAGRTRTDAVRGLTPGALGWCLTLPEYQPRPGTNGTGRRHGDRAARRSHAGRTDGEPTTRRDDGRRPDAPAAGTARSALPNDEAFGYLKRVIVTPAVYPRLLEFLHTVGFPWSVPVLRRPDRPATANRHRADGRPRRGQRPKLGGSTVADGDEPATASRLPVLRPGARATAGCRSTAYASTTTRTRSATLLRANPYPEVTDRFCRLPLPTLFYAARGCSPRRPAADIGTNRREDSAWPSLEFQGPRGVTDTAATSGALRARVPIARLEDSRDVQRSQRKENSSRTPRLLRVHSGRPDETKEPRTLGSGSASGSGIRTGFPLAPWAIRKRLRPWYEDLSPGLGSTDSWTTAVHKKPFSTAAPRPLSSICYYTKICTDAAPGGLATCPSTHTAAPSYSSGLPGPTAASDAPAHYAADAEYRHDAPAPSISELVASAVHHLSVPTCALRPETRRRPTGPRLRRGRVDVLAVGRADQEHRGSARSVTPKRDRRDEPPPGPSAGANESRRPLTERKIRPAVRPTVNSPGGTRGLCPFTPERFHVLMNSLFKVLFNFPSRYLSTIGLVAVFSLRWSLPPASGCTLKQPDSKARSDPGTL